eukprot:340176_1
MSATRLSTILNHLNPTSVDIKNSCNATSLDKNQHQTQKIPLPPLNAPFVSVQPILTGTLMIAESLQIMGGSNKKDEVTSLVFLIKHPKHGLLLFDGGLSKEISKPNYGKLSKHEEFFNSFDVKIDKNFISTAHFIQRNLK